MSMIEKNKTVYILATTDYHRAVLDPIYSEIHYKVNETPTQTWRVCSSHLDLKQHLSDLSRFKVYMVGKFMWDWWEESQEFYSLKEAWETGKSIRDATPLCTEIVLIDASSYSFT